MRKLLFSAASVVLLAAVTLAPAQSANPRDAQARIDEVIASLSRGYAIGQVAISPDGKRVAWIEGGRGAGRLHIAATAGFQNKKVKTESAAAPECAANFPLWTPDAKELIFVGTCGEGEQRNFYAVSDAAKKPRRLSDLNGEVDDPAVAPDGSAVGFLYVDGATRPAGALAAMKSPSGVMGEDGVEVQRVAMIPLGKEAARPQFLSPASLHVYEFDWRPDAKAIAYTAANPPGENNWWVAKLYTQELGAEPKAILEPATVAGPLHGLQMALPRWSPDAGYVAFIGGLMSDQGVTGGDLWVVPAAGGKPENLTPARPTSVEWFIWETDHTLLLNELAGGEFQLVRLEVQASEAAAPQALAAAKFSEPLFHLPMTVGANGLEASLSATADHKLFAFRASSMEQAPEILFVEPSSGHGEPSAFAGSHFNEGLEAAWGTSESLQWTSGGFHVQGWLVLPKDYDPKKKYPMIVEVHGGPAYAETSRWGGNFALSPAAFSAMGYFVLLPNPRGSFGQGEAFTQANRKDFGYGDLTDILAGVDAVLARYPVDAKRVGITGWSYGGFMTMFSVTQTERFRAAVAGAGIANWQSYYGENSIDQWMIPFFGASVYDDPAVYAKSSAINFIDKVKTPTLVVVGDRDGECPAPQSFEFWHGLRDHHVPTQLVVYPNEGHGFRDPAHTRDVLERAIAWFGKYMAE